MCFWGRQERDANGSAEVESRGVTLARSSRQRMLSDAAASTRLAVAIVAPSLAILGGQAVQARRLLDAWANDEQIATYLVPINPVVPRWLRPLTRIKYARTLVTQLIYLPSLVREMRRADVVHVFSASYWSFLLAPLPAVIVARLLGKPVVMNYRSGEAPDHLRRSAIARWTLRTVDANVVPSSFLRGVFAQYGIAAEIIPNIVDRDRFRFRLRDPLRPAIVSTRNFEALYNVSCTLRAFARVQGQYPEATLTLVGSGSEEAALRVLADKLGLRGVTFAGRVAPEDIWRYYADADIYVQTPDIDNMPASILEAFASGLPVVATNIGGVPAILTDGVHGLLAPANEADEVSARVIRLLEDPACARRLALAAFDTTDALVWDRVRDRWAALYRSLVDRPAAEAPSVRPV
jgi:L-malate glycosyltransferase